MVVIGSRVHKSGGEAIILSQVEIIAKRYKSVPVYDENTGTATVVIEVKEGEKKAYVNGRYLEEGIYRIWYENENSIVRKLELMNEYGLRGAGLWALGNESDDFWKWYSEGFNDEEYESEKSIKERAFYEYVEVLKSQTEPLSIVRQIEIDSKRIGNNEKKLSKIKYEFVKYENGRFLKVLKRNNEKVVEKEKYLKGVDKISIVHIIKRYGKE